MLKINELTYDESLGKKALAEYDWSVKETNGKNENDTKEEA